MAVLDSAIAGVREDLVVRQARVNLEDLKERARKMPSALSAEDALRGNNERSLSIIAEVKRPSPSRGSLASIEDPARLAQMYEEGGTTAIPVLTEKRRFRGSSDDLDAARARVGTPVLRKDFIVTPYRIWEARAHGADIVLLIVAALEQTVLMSFVERIHSLGMTALAETRDRGEARRTIDAGARVVGVNAHNLKALDVDMRVSDQVVDIPPSDTAKVTESDVRGSQDVLNYARSGASAVLVGEALVTSDDPRSAIGDMVVVGHHPSLDARGR